MKLQILFGLTLSLFIFSCNKKTSSSPSNATTPTNMCLALSDGTIPDPIPVKRSGLALTNDTVTVDSQKIGKTSALRIHTNAAKIASKAESDGETPPFFIMYHICKKEDQNCIQSNQWTQTANFTIDNIIGSPKGNLIVSTMLCVDDISFVSADDGSQLSKRCSDAEPCYCGQQLDIPFTNNGDPNDNDKTLETLAAKIHIGRDQLHKLAIGYQKEAQAYVRKCLPHIKSTADLQSAQNINNLSSSDLAAIAENFDTRNFISQVQTLAATTTKLALADTPTPNCPSGLVPSAGGSSSSTVLVSNSSSADDSSPSSSQVSTTSSTNSSSQSSTSATKIGSTSNSANTSTESAVSPATASNQTPGWQKPVIIGLGGVAVIAGAALVASWALERFSTLRIEDLLNILGNSKAGLFVRGARTIADLTQRAQAAYDNMDKALKEGNWENFNKARAEFHQVIAGGEDIGLGKKSLGLRAVFQKHLGATAIIPKSFEQGLSHLESMEVEFRKIGLDGTTITAKEIHLLGEGSYTGPLTGKSLTDIMTDDEVKIMDLENKLKDKFLNGTPGEYKTARQAYLDAWGDPTKYQEIEASPTDAKSFKEGIYTLDGKKFTIDSKGFYTQIDGKPVVGAKADFLKSWQKEIPPTPDPKKIFAQIPDRTPNTESSKKSLILGAIAFAAGVDMIASTTQLAQSTTPPALTCGQFSQTSYFWESQMASVLDNLNQAKSDFAKKSQN